MVVRPERPELAKMDGVTIKIVIEQTPGPPTETINVWCGSHLSIPKNLQDLQYHLRKKSREVLRSVMGLGGLTDKQIDVELHELNMGILR